TGTFSEEWIIFKTQLHGFWRGALRLAQRGVFGANEKPGCWSYYWFHPSMRYRSCPVVCADCGGNSFQPLEHLSRSGYIFPACLESQELMGLFSISAPSWHFQLSGYFFHFDAAIFWWRFS